MKHALKNWRTTIGGLIYALGYVPQFTAFSDIFHALGALIIGASAQDAPAPEKDK